MRPGRIRFPQGLRGPRLGFLLAASLAAGYTIITHAVLEIFDGATSLGSVSLQSNANDFADQFLGLRSDTAFNRIEVTYSRPDAQQLSVYIDDLYLGDGVRVQEPAALSLLGLGLLGLGFARRRKTAG